jgi:hypothetical protein
MLTIGWPVVLLQTGIHTEYLAPEWMSTSVALTHTFTPPRSTIPYGEKPGFFVGACTGSGKFRSRNRVSVPTFQSPSVVLQKYCNVDVSLRYAAVDITRQLSFRPAGGILGGDAHTRLGGSLLLLCSTPV